MPTETAPQNAKNIFNSQQNATVESKDSDSNDEKSN